MTLSPKQTEAADSAEYPKGKAMTVYESPPKMQYVSGSAIAPEPQPEVPNLVLRLESRLEGLAQSIQVLSNRLDNVVRSAPPMANSTAVTREVSKTPLGDKLFCLIDATETMASRLGDLTHRLEL